MADYRLQTLLEMRERTKKDKEEALAEAKKRLALEQQKLEELRKQLQDMRDMRVAKQEELMAKTQAGEMGIDGYLKGERYLKRVDREIVEFEENEIRAQEKRIIFAEQEVQWAYDEMLEAMQEFKALEKHKENWAAELKAERQAKEELQMEEIATTIFTYKNS